MATVGYGDIVPHTAVGKVVSAVLILLGYSLIIIPTGFVSAELIGSKMARPTTQACPHCMAEGHDSDAQHCKHCGGRL
jgi:voltage-gated potassium channel